MSKPKIYLPYKLCADLMDCLAAVAYNVTNDIEASEHYAKNRFAFLLTEFEDINGFEFVIIENSTDIQEIS